MIDRPEEYEKMDLAEKELWWYKILHEQTYAAIQKKHQKKDLAILDAGCGTGGLICYLQSKGFTHVKGFDISVDAVDRSRRKTAGDIEQLSIQEASGYYSACSFDVVICNDALYFISDKEFPKALNSLLNLLKKDGQLIINLPAGNWYRGMHDRTVGIQERWSLSKFKQMLNVSGATYDHYESWNWPFLLSPFIGITRFIQRLKLRLFPSDEMASDVTLPPLALNHIFYKLTKWENQLPFKRKTGSSIFIIIHR